MSGSKVDAGTSDEYAGRSEILREAHNQVRVDEWIDNALASVDGIMKYNKISEAYPITRIAHYGFLGIINVGFALVSQLRQNNKDNVTKLEQIRAAYANRENW